MEPGVLDHLLTVLLVVVAPVAGLRAHDRLVRLSRDGHPEARVATYRNTMAKEWAVLVVVLAVWFLAGRGLVDLGFRLQVGTWAWIGWAVAAGAVVGLVLQAVLVPRSPSGREALRRQMADLRDLVPHDAREARLFAALSVTAGICEEIVFRGFLLAYFESLLGLWPAVALSSLVFGLGHAYQGVRGIFKTAGVGLVMALLVVLTGGLWAAILVHAVIDLTSGSMARRVLQDEDVLERQPGTSG